MFRDLIEIKIKAGHGGAGVATFDILQRPNGGNGGKGGDVYVVGTEHEYDLSRLKKAKLYKAEDGQQGSSNTKTGSDGKDIHIQVPLTSVLYSSDGEEIAVIEKHNQQVLIAQGGIGGRGNYDFRAGGFETKYKKQIGLPGEEILDLNIELQLQSNYILIGFPNAGKSSLLRELTNVEAKVAAYAFTTIDPQLGDMDGIRILDLPGLIEGTHEGKGLGTRFVKHTKRTDCALHCVSLEDEDPVQSYKTMRQELEKIDAELAQKPEIIILTKSDALAENEIKKIQKSFKTKFKKEILTFSILDDEKIQNLKKALKKAL